MGIDSAADTIGGYYGRWEPAKKNKPATFVKLGKAVYLDKVTVNIENREVKWELSSTYMGEPCYKAVSKGDITDCAVLAELSKVGIDVPKKNFDTFIDALRKQEEDIDAQGIPPEKVYDHLGWIQLPIRNGEGAITGSTLHYRASKLIGGFPARYDGNYSVKPMGSFDAWRDMVKADVVGFTPMELVLVVSLSAIVNGLIAGSTTGENPIVHLCARSGCGKTTALYLGTAVFGVPYEGERKSFGRGGEIITRRSAYGSWGATENATITQCAGNKGALVVLNELGKFHGSDMSTIVYNLSEGSDKARLNSKMKVYLSESYFTSILSAGEVSLLGRCADKVEGIPTRVMELDQMLTKDAEHSRRVKEVCRKHNGWAAPKMAEHIIANGGEAYVLPIYKGYCKSLMSVLPANSSTARFVEKFAALFMTTAEIASKALDIPFDLAGLQQFFVEYEATKGQERNMAANSYDVIIEACRTNKKCFYVDKEPPAGAKLHGKITTPGKLLDDGRVVVEEFSVRRSFLEKVLKDNGFPNTTTCADEWKKMGVLDYEVGRLTRSRKIDPKAGKPEDVFVFRVFGDHVVPPKAKPKSKLVMKAPVAPPNGSKRDWLLGEGGEEDEQTADT